MDILMKSKGRGKGGIEAKAMAAEGTMTIKKGNNGANLAMGRR